MYKKIGYKAKAYNGFINFLKMNLQSIILKFLFLLIIQYPANAQNIEIYGQIKDKDSFIPFAHVIFKKQNSIIYGEVANENGFYKIILHKESIKTIDKIYFSCIGYETTSKTIDINKSIQQIDIIMNPETYSLQDVEVTGVNFKKAKTKNVGFKVNSNPEGQYYFGYGTEIALFISNTEKAKGIISQARFYIKDEGFPQTKFRVKIYEADSSSSPGKSILNKSLIVSAKNGNEWVVVDLTEYQISIPSNGFFIAMEWLPDAQNKKNKNGNANVNGQVLGSVTQSMRKPPLTWIKSLKHGWKKNNLPKTGVFMGEEVKIINQQNAAIGGEIKVVK